MTHDLELVLTHDGRFWVGRNAALGLELKGETLAALDAAMQAWLAARPEWRGRKVSVFMGFDNATIPTWIRQYAAHYSNRVVEFDLSGKQQKTQAVAL
jgi:hypothetical protein